MEFHFSACHKIFDICLNLFLLTPYNKSITIKTAYSKGFGARIKCCNDFVSVGNLMLMR